MRESNPGEGPSLAVVFFIQRERGWLGRGREPEGGWESKDVKALVNYKLLGKEIDDIK